MAVPRRLRDQFKEFLEEQGEDVDADLKSLNTDELNNNLVYDSTGRYLGELTGSGDDQVVTDAIAERRANANVIVPNPGFALGWDSEVVIPADERGFGLLTVGQPQIDISSSFSGSAIRKPSSTASNNALKNYRIGPFFVNDFDNNAADWAIDLDDIKSARIDPIVVLDTPGIRIQSTNTYSNNNMIMRPEISTKSGRGPGILLDNNGVTTDQTWIFAPGFIDGFDFSETAYVDRGKHNNWIQTRCETARVVHEQDGGRNYSITEGNWDRSGNMEYTVLEKNGSNGVINELFGPNYPKLQLSSPATQVQHVGWGDGDWTGAENLLDGFTRITSATPLSAMGFRDSSSGGSVNINPATYKHPALNFDTGATANNTAVMDLGDGSLKGVSFPKATQGFAPDGGAGSDDVTNVVVRWGLYNNDSNRAELIYDPTNNLGNHTTSNWWFEVETGGTVRDRIDMGAAPANPQTLTLNRVEKGDSSIEWSAAIDGGSYQHISNGGADIPRSTWRWSLETLEAVDKRWRLMSINSGTLYRD